MKRGIQRYYSTIYWHFTGSPEKVDWHKVSSPRDILSQDSPKPCETSVEIIKKILSSGLLRAGTTEKIVEGLETEKFCCVCDIPFKDLLTHSEYYGQAAIGFSASSIQKEFNPVFYINYDKIPIDGNLAVPDDTVIGDEDKIIGDENDSAFKLIETLFNSEEGGHQLAKSLGLSLGSLKNYIKITKFSGNDEETFYREREWRCIKDFIFAPSEVEALLVPKRFIPQIREWLTDKDYKNTSIISYEFLRRA